ncbi:hypothetical protein EUX98_g4485 [Antrodiella citrinella]|uniref:SH3 domain-containing protein n=1 Tax=Antrodiella citrinella TaxID=2447956 RepID=A0A4S4MTV6_9APHY|nr:hypothetical protein EUX98_g4485 [Antrodiella citrinella]
MKLNTPLPQPLPKECQKASKIFRSFVDGANNGLDGIIPRSVLEGARGFAIFTVFKAGFLFSARAGSGVVIARLDDGTWSAPSAIGTAGVGFGGQAGAEMTDFLVVLNSRAAVRSFMSAGSITLGGNLSIAVGPLGRNGEATGSLNTGGKLAAMYSYSKTRGLFGGISLEGSVIMERQDANAIAYRSDVTARMLLSGSVDIPEWAGTLTQTLEDCTGAPAGRRWVQELEAHHTGQPARSGSYMFSGSSSPGLRNGSATLKKKERPGYFSRTSSNSGFDFRDRSPDSLSPGVDDDFDGRPALTSKHSSASAKKASSTVPNFPTQFHSDYVPDSELRKHPKLVSSPTEDDDDYVDGSPFNSAPASAYSHTGRSSVTRDASHRRSVSAYTPKIYPAYTVSRDRSSSLRSDGPDVGDDYIEDLDGRPPVTTGQKSKQPVFVPNPELSKPLKPSDGVARAIALFDFNAVQDGDLSFTKGQVITVKYMNSNTDTWWLGRVDGREGIFPANFVEVV